MSRKSSARFKCCLKCRLLLQSQANICPNCKSDNFSFDWSGLVVVFDPENSAIAKMLKITKPGKYAIKCR
ncbi:MAG: transcription elongation factor subunit Spt4 [Candidatus Nezhaarchaeota archaeon]|nr:transcription elongation factor subunit Spt4 [Candidatus Nezhaarchaeota archaeon]